MNAAELNTHAFDALHDRCGLSDYRSMIREGISTSSDLNHCFRVLD